MGRACGVAGAALLVALIGTAPDLIPRSFAQPEPRTITVATYDLEPFVMTRDGIKTGFTIDLLDAIGKRNGWTFDYVEGQNVQEIIADVTNGRVDAAAAAISITSERAKFLDFSQPILNAGLQIAVPVDAVQRSRPGLVNFLKLLFSTSIAVWLLAALVLTIVPAHILWLLERRHSHSMVSRSYFPGILQAFGWGLGTLAASADDGPRHWHGRALGVLWAFVAIIFIAYYTATLTANLTVEKIGTMVASPGDLINRKVCTVADTTSADRLAEVRVRFTGAPTVEDCYAGLTSGAFEAIVFDAPILQYWVTHEGAEIGTLAGPVFDNEDYGIAFPVGSELRKDVDDALLSMRESGDFELIRGKWLGYN